MYDKLVLGLALVLMSLNAWAEDDIIGGNDCGKTEDDQCFWSLNTKTGELVISGTGQMADYDNYAVSPWHEYDLKIKKIEIDEGITSVGARAFITSVTEVSLPTTLISIGEMAFWGGALQSLTIPEGVTEIGEGAFNGNNITNVEIPLKLTSLMENVFSSNPIKTLFIPDNVTDINEYAFYCDGCWSTTVGKAMPLEAIYCTEAQMEQCTVAASYLNAEPTMYSKDSNGNLYVYDGKGNVVGKYTSVADLKGGKATETYKYDPAGHLVGIFDANGQRTWGKKIYTVEEAMEVTKDGDKFHVYLTYK